MISKIEEAISLHLEMWTDMKKKLGDNPTEYERKEFMREWIRGKFPNENVFSNWTLCEYTRKFGLNEDGLLRCAFCPIDWKDLKAHPENKSTGCCAAYHKSVSESIWTTAPISEILSLPVDKVMSQLIT